MRLVSAVVLLCLWALPIAAAAESHQVFIPVVSTQPEGAGLLNPFERELLQLINQERVSRGLAPLQVNATLVRTAREHNQDMIQHNFFSHQGSDGRWPSERGCARGYLPYPGSGCMIAENIAGGQSTAQECFNAWMNSSSHRDNLLNPTSREIGLGYASGGTWRHYWTATLGVQPGVFPVFINGDAAQTASRTVQMTLTRETLASWLDFAEPEQVWISEDPNFAGASPQAWAPGISFTLSAGNGTKTVYVRLIDNGQNVVSHDTIVLVN